MTSKPLRLWWDGETLRVAPSITMEDVEQVRRRLEALEQELKKNQRNIVFQVQTGKLFS